MYRVIIAALVIASTLASTRPAAAASWRVYHNSTFGYSLAYPNDWQQISESNVDIELRTTDTGATFIAHAETTTSVLKLADLQGAVSSVLYAAGVPRANTIHYTTPMLHHVAFADGSVSVQANGKAGTVNGLVAYRAHAVYFFISSLVRMVNGKQLPAATAQARDLARIETSIVVTGPAK